MKTKHQAAKTDVGSGINRGRQEIFVTKLVSILSCKDLPIFLQNSWGGKFENYKGTRTSAKPLQTKGVWLLFENVSTCNWMSNIDTTTRKQTGGYKPYDGSSPNPPSAAAVSLMKSVFTFDNTTHLWCTDLDPFGSVLFQCYSAKRWLFIGFLDLLILFWINSFYVLALNRRDEIRGSSSTLMVDCSIFRFFPPSPATVDDFQPAKVFEPSNQDRRTSSIRALSHLKYSRCLVTFCVTDPSEAPIIRVSSSCLFWLVITKSLNKTTQFSTTMFMRVLNI